MSHPRAGKPALPEDLIDVASLVTAYYTRKPDPAVVEQQVAFGTSGHRGTSFKTSFNEDHILATTQAICDYRQAQGFDGPLFIGRDTHGLSEPAWASALEVLVANGVDVCVDAADRYTPTPAVSHAILTANRGRIGGVNDLPAHKGLADGIVGHSVAQPAHRRQASRYNPPAWRPGRHRCHQVDRRTRQRIHQAGLKGVKRVPFERARKQARPYDYLGTYVNDLPNVLDLDAIRNAGVRIGADPLGGASVDYWGAIAERHKLNLTVVNPLVDPTWRFMTLDWDGKIRMDCSSPSAMASLVAQKDKYDIASGNDADADRHGIVTPDAGLMNPNHYLAVAIQYLFGARQQWPKDGFIGKTLVSSSMIDRVAQSLGAPAGRGARGLQVVRAGSPGRQWPLRRRRIGRSLLPASRRHRLEHRQGRHHPGTAGLRDPGPHRQEPQPALCRTHRPLRQPRLCARRCSGQPRAEGQAVRPGARERQGCHAGR